jgi:aminopeptidase N
MVRFVLSLCLAGLVTKASSQGSIDVIHYSFSIEVSDSSDRVKGHAVITAQLPENSTSFYLQLRSRNETGRGMIVQAVQLEGKPIAFTHARDSILITLPFPSKINDTLHFSVDYEGVPEDGLIIARNKFGDRTFFADNWPDRAHHWIPCIDRPIDKASFEFIVTAPAKYSVVSNGTRVQQTDLPGNRKMTHWVESIPLSTKIMVIGIARFAIKTFPDSPAGTPVSAWSYPQDSSRTFQNFSASTSILRFLSNYIGPYPYEKLANVQSKTIFGGMENASAIFYDENLSAATESIEGLLSHEIVHQWFGDMASEKSFAHLWLSEGFATYLTHVYMESKYGAARMKQEMSEDRISVIEFSKTSPQPVVDSISPFRRLLNPNSYQKGGWVLHMLRRQLGDTVFHRIIRRYYATFAGRNADTRDFQVVCEQESGKKLDVFFRQWLYTRGQPRLSVQWTYDEKKRKIQLNISQLQPSVFEFPLDIEIRFRTGRSRVETVQVTGMNQTLSIPSNQRPLKIVLDPRVSLLFEEEAR